MPDAFDLPAALLDYAVASRRGSVTVPGVGRRVPATALVAAEHGPLFTDGMLRVLGLRQQLDGTLEPDAAEAVVRRAFGDGVAVTSYLSGDVRARRQLGADLDAAGLTKFVASEYPVVAGALSIRGLGGGPEGLLVPTP